MHQLLLQIHSITRWLVLLSLIVAIYTAYNGYSKQLVFSKRMNLVRHWTATIAHIQLILGMILYTQSPVVKYFWSNFKTAIKNIDSTFFGIIHLVFMITAITFITIGSSLSKREQENAKKYKIMWKWFALALLFILLAIPWPFSPLAHRPFIR